MQVVFQPCQDEGTDLVVQLVVPQGAEDRVSRVPVEAPEFRSRLVVDDAFGHPLEGFVDDVFLEQLRDLDVEDSRDSLIDFLGEILERRMGVELPVLRTRRVGEQQGEDEGEQGDDVFHRVRGVSLGLVCNYDLAFRAILSRNYVSKPKAEKN